MATLTTSVKLEMKLEGNRKMVFLVFGNGSSGADTLAAGSFGSITSIDAVMLTDTATTGGLVTTVAFPATALAVNTTHAPGSLLIIGQ